MRLQHLRRLLEARDTGRTVCIRTLSGRRLCGQVEAVAATADGGELEGQVVVETSDRHTECLDIALILTVSAAEWSALERRAARR